MGKGTVHSHVGDALYSTTLNYARIYSDKQIAKLNTEHARLTTVERPKVDADLAANLQDKEDAVSAYDLAVSIYSSEPTDANRDAVYAANKDMLEKSEKWRIAKASKDSLEARITAIQKRKSWFEGNQKEDETINLWCADCSDDVDGRPVITAETISGLIELENTTDFNPIIRPAYPADHAWNASRDGMIGSPVEVSPAGFYFNLALKPPAEKWSPIYKHGIVTGRSGAQLTVDITNKTHKGESLIKTDPEDCDVSYMDCNHLAFKIGDDVVVEYAYDDNPAAWISDHAYGVDDIVAGGEKFKYKCKKIHLSNDDNKPGSAKWQQYWESHTQDNWYSGWDYSIGDKVKNNYNGWTQLSVYDTGNKVAVYDDLEDELKSFSCLATHTAAANNRPLSGENWRSYWVGIENPHYYECILPHQASSTNEPGVGLTWGSYWDHKNLAAEWADTTAYALDQLSSIEDREYICIKAHDSSEANKPETGGGWTTFWDKVAKDELKGTVIGFAKNPAPCNQTHGFGGYRQSDSETSQASRLEPDYSGASPDWTLSLTRPSVGNIDWQGWGEDMLTFIGPNSRYFLVQKEMVASYQYGYSGDIFKGESLYDTCPESILGCALHHEYINNVKHTWLVTVSYNSYGVSYPEYKVRARKKAPVEGVWTTILTQPVDELPTFNLVYNIEPDTMFLFNASGTEASGRTWGGDSYKFNISNFVDGSDPVAIMTHFVMSGSEGGVGKSTTTTMTGSVSMTVPVETDCQEHPEWIEHKQTIKEGECIKTVTTSYTGGEKETVYPICFDYIGDQLIYINGYCSGGSGETIATSTESYDQTADYYYDCADGTLDYQTSDTTRYKEYTESHNYTLPGRGWVNSYSGVSTLFGGGTRTRTLSISMDDHVVYDSRVGNTTDDWNTSASVSSTETLTSLPGVLAADLRHDFYVVIAVETTNTLSGSGSGSGETINQTYTNTYRYYAQVYLKGVMVANEEIPEEYSYLEGNTLFASFNRGNWELYYGATEVGVANCGLSYVEGESDTHSSSWTTNSAYSQEDVYLDFKTMNYKIGRTYPTYWTNEIKSLPSGEKVFCFEIPADLSSISYYEDPTSTGRYLLGLYDSDGVSWDLAAELGLSGDNPRWNNLVLW